MAALRHVSFKSVPSAPPGDAAAIAAAAESALRTALASIDAAGEPVPRLVDIVRHTEREMLAHGVPPSNLPSWGWLRSMAGCDCAGKNPPDGCPVHPLDGSPIDAADPPAARGDACASCGHVSPHTPGCADCDCEGGFGVAGRPPEAAEGETSWLGQRLRDPEFKALFDIEMVKYREEYPEVAKRAFAAGRRVRDMLATPAVTGAHTPTSAPFSNSTETSAPHPPWTTVTKDSGKPQVAVTGAHTVQGERQLRRLLQERVDAYKTHGPEPDEDAADVHFAAIVDMEAILLAAPFTPQDAATSGDEGDDILNPPRCKECGKPFASMAAAAFALCSADMCWAQTWDSCDPPELQGAPQDAPAAGDPGEVEKVVESMWLNAHDAKPHSDHGRSSKAIALFRKSEAALRAYGAAAEARGADAMMERALDALRNVPVAESGRPRQVNPRELAMAMAMQAVRHAR